MQKDFEKVHRKQPQMVRKVILQAEVRLLRQGQLPKDSGRKTLTEKSMKSLSKLNELQDNSSAASKIILSKHRLQVSHEGW